MMPEDQATRTRVVLGSGTHPGFVSQQFRGIVENLASLMSPSVMIREKPKVIYEIPSHQVNFMAEMKSHCKYYVACGDSYLEYCEVIEPLSKSVHQQERSKNSGEFDRISIYREHVTPEFFILMQNAKYSNVTIYKNRNVVYLLAWGISWRLESRDVYLNPRSSEADPYSLWFCGSPKHEIVLSTYDDLPRGDKDVTAVLSMILPREYSVFTKCTPYDIPR